MPLKIKNYTQHQENRRLGLIESLHMQHCSLRGRIRPSAGLSGIRFSKLPGWAQWFQRKWNITVLLRRKLCEMRLPRPDSDDTQIAFSLYNVHFLSWGTANDPINLRTWAIWLAHSKFAYDQKRSVTARQICGFVTVYIICPLYFPSWKWSQH